MKRILPALCLLVAPLVCQASHVDILLMGGPAFTHMSNSDRVGLNQYMVNEYKIQSQSHSEPMFGLGVSRTFTNFSKPVSLSLGLSGYDVDYGKLKGLEHPFINDGIYDPLDFKLHAQSLALLLESRMAYTQYAWQPYVIAGIGASWNRLYNYYETPTVPANTASAALSTFSNHTQSAFAYEIGLGVQRQIFNTISDKFHYFVSLDYRYMNNGKGELGRSLLQTTNNHYQISSLHTQALMLSLKVSV